MTVKVGIEIEMASTPTNETDRVIIYELHNKWVRVHDGSVKCKHNRSGYHICNECQEMGVQQNEFRTNGATGAYTINLNDIESGVNAIANDFKRILDTLENVSANKSCGIHFHFSGIKKYGVFYSDDFLDWLKEKYTSFCKNKIERDRLNSDWCDWTSFFNHPSRGDERYRAVNIKGAFQKHNTFEFRFFPSTANIATLKRYIRFVLEVLKEVKEKNYEKSSVKAICDLTPIKEEYSVLAL